MGIELLSQKLFHLPDEPLMIGLSGGADSVALTMMLLLQRKDGLAAVHVNHGLRGAESDGDEEFVRNLCRAKGIPLAVYRAELGGRRDEKAAREARFAFFRRAMKENGAAALVLAHHRDDLTETFLMRLLRGSGTEGLRCMVPDDGRMGIRVLRPMLGITRREIREALEEDGIPWREDSSNTDSRYLRNAVRSRLIPLMEEISPGSSGRIAGAAGRAALDSEALEEAARSAAGSSTGKPWLDTDLMNGYPEAVQARILREWWRKNGPALDEHELNERQTRELLRLAQKERGTVNLPGNRHCVKRNETLFLEEDGRRKPEPAAFQAPETLFEGIRLRQLNGQTNPGDGKTCQEVPIGFADGCLIRTREDGDRIRPFGSSGSRKLQDYLTDRKISQPWRDRIPLLCRGKEVLLVCGVGAGAVPRWNLEEKHVRLQWIGDMPWMKETESKG